MKSSPSRVTRDGRATRVPASVPAAFGEQLSRLYDLAEYSTHVFASPIGPLTAAQPQRFLPRFVYFGPGSSDVSVRLALLAGLRRDELVSTAALLRFVEQLIVVPTLGEQLSLSFFPLVDVDGASSSGVKEENWTNSLHPEVQLLARDAMQRQYHGFIRLESTDDDVITIRLRTIDDVRYPAPPVDLIGDTETAPFPVRWESESVAAFLDGPLSLGPDLHTSPFELTVRLPRRWSLELHQRATASIFSKFVQRHRAFVAYGLHL